MSDRNPTEPSADIREMASAMWQLFVGLQNEGFTETQALTIIGHVLAANGGRS